MGALSLVLKYHRTFYFLSLSRVEQVLYTHWFENHRCFIKINYHRTQGCILDLDYHLSLDLLSLDNNVNHYHSEFMIVNRYSYRYFFLLKHLKFCRHSRAHWSFEYNLERIKDIAIIRWGEQQWPRYLFFEPEDNGDEVDALSAWKQYRSF